MYLDPKYYTQATDNLKSIQEDKLFKEWTKGVNITKIISLPLQQIVLVLIEEDENVFTLQRYFRLSDESWRVSHDLMNTDSSNVMDYLIGKLTDDDGQLIIEPNVFYDKYSEKITIGCDVVCDETDDNKEFQGTVERFETISEPAFAVVIDQDGDAFCIDVDKLEVV
jgi:hypothetical protein